MKRNRLPLLKYACVICAVTFIGCNLVLHKDLFEAQRELLFGTDSFHKKYGKAALIELTTFDTKIEIPLGFLKQDVKLHRRLLGSVSNRNRSSNNFNRNPNSHSVHLDVHELSRVLSDISRCQNIEFNATKVNFIGSGWTKAVYRGQVKGQPVAVKTVDEDGFQARNCKSSSPKQTSRCFQESASKILREIAILQKIKHPNIVQLVAHCTEVTPSHVPTQVLLATELGNPVDIIKLLQLSWEDRLRISYGLSKLVSFLAQSPYGSIVLNDFRREQFVFVDGDIKLTDLDDIGFDEPHCLTDKDCSVFFSSSNFTLRTKCYQHHCENFNEKLNIYNTGRHFTSFLLPHGCPQNLKNTVGSIVHGFSNATMSSDELLSKMEDVLLQYSQGQYLTTNSSKRVSVYKEFLASDLPGEYDYSCRYAIGIVCSLSVFDRQEAEEMCDKDTSCAGFVWSSQVTWTGRRLAIFKNNFRTPSYNADTILYVKPGTVT